MNNSHLSTNRTNKINSSFFDNIINTNTQKKAKLKNLIFKISQKRIQMSLKNCYMKWKIKENDKTKNDNKLIKDKINLEINDINEINNSNKKNEADKEEENDIQKNNNIFKEVKIIENGAKNYNKNLEFNENIFPAYEEMNNNSINIINENGNNVFKEIKKNEENQIIDDDFDIKINEEMIIHRKENSKIKSDIFDSNDINSSYLKDKLNINDNTIINSPEKIKNQSKVDFLETNNEICNVSNSNTHRDNINTDKNNLINEISQNKKDEKIIIDENKIELNKIKERREKFKEEIRKTFNKNIIYDSLENIDFNNELISYGNKGKKQHLIKNNTVGKISKTKKQILNHFMTDNPISEKDHPNNKAPKRLFYKISSTNNICLKNNAHNISRHSAQDTKDKNSFNNTNLSKIENIFIKGNKNNNKTKTENVSKKKLQLFIIDKNSNIQIDQKKKEEKKEKLKEYDLIIGNNIIKNNIYERLINSNMINDFLKNTKNEPMFPKKNFETIQCPNQNSKINLNINNIINFSINKSNPKVKTEENKSKNIILNNLNNNFIYERKNHFYFKKVLNIGKKNSNSNINNKRSISNRINKKDTLKLNELELMEPNIQKCPVSLRKEIKGYYEGKKTNSMKKDNIYYIKKDYNTNSIKRKKKLPKSLSTEIINEKITNKKKIKRENSNSSYHNTSLYNNYNNKNNKTNFISEDLLNFIDCIKTNQEKEKSKENEQKIKKDVYNFNGIKYSQINTYREKNKKQNKNSSLIVDSFKRIYNYKLNHKDNYYSKKETERNNNSIGKNNKNRNVDYKRLNELYLDYKVKDIKRNKLKNEQDINRGITFVPYINKIGNKK